jgi:hypothetical protein
MIATLTWYQSADTSTLGYLIYAGRSSRDYTGPGSPMGVGNLTTGTLETQRQRAASRAGL